MVWEVEEEEEEEEVVAAGLSGFDAGAPGVIRHFDAKEPQDRDTEEEEKESVRRDSEAEAKAAADALKASARAKLIAGTPLTEAEAAVLVI